MDANTTELTKLSELVNATRAEVVVAALVWYATHDPDSILAATDELTKAVENYLAVRDKFLDLMRATIDTQ